MDGMTHSLIFFPHLFPLQDENLPMRGGRRTPDFFFIVNAAATLLIIVCCMLRPTHSYARRALAFVALPNRSHFCTASLSRSFTSRSMSSVADLRKEYSASGLVEENMPSEPLSVFRQWLDEAVAAQVLEPNAMCLSTVSSDGKPSGRFVLLKGLDDRGFTWFTNYQSRKGHDLAGAPMAPAVTSSAAIPPSSSGSSPPPFAALTFWWGDLERSVRVEGWVERLSEEASQAYFDSRPRGSRIGAWASEQSRPIGSRSDLESQYASVSARFGGEEGNDSAHPIPKPAQWGGFRLVPERVEFWKGRQSRLHDRLIYTLEEDKAGRIWKLTRLQP